MTMLRTCIPALLIAAGIFLVGELPSKSMPSAMRETGEGEAAVDYVASRVGPKTLKTEYRKCIEGCAQYGLDAVAAACRTRCNKQWKLQQ